MLENPLDIVKLLSGAELKVYLIMGIVRTRVNVAFLVRNSGYTDKPVSKALLYLEDRGMASHTSSGWQLTRGVAQLPLMVDAPVEIEVESGADTQVRPYEEDDNSDDNGGSRNNSDSLLVSLVNIDSINQVNLTDDLTKLTNGEESRKNSDIDNLWGELDAVGVKRNRATEAIAALDWVDSGYIRGMILKLEGEGRTWPKDCGLLLYRLKQKPKAMRHGRDCRCDGCDVKRRMRYADR